MSSNGNKPRVVITGIGAVTPLGHTWPESWQAMLAGKSAGRAITYFDASAYPSRIVASVEGFDPTKFMERKEARRMGEITHFAWAAAKEAVANAKLDLASMDRDRIGIELGSAFGAMGMIEEQALVLYRDGPKAIKPSFGPAVLISTTPCYVAIELGITGPVTSQMAACATGIASVGEGMRRLQRGEVDVMLAGGADSFKTPLIMATFSRLGAMSTRNDDPAGACRPFCATRDGMVMGEGAVLLVLETLEHAQARGAHILAEITGYSLTSDAFNLAAPHPEGLGAAKAMSKALADAGRSGEQVDYICAHGTATQLNDSMETSAIKKALGEAAYETRISSVKSMLGHMMAAAGAVSIATVVGAIQDGWLPPTINYHEPDPECDLNYVPNQAEQHPVAVGMANAFGFGGQNASIVIERWPGS